MRALRLRPPTGTSDWAMLVLGAALVYFSCTGIIKGLASAGWPEVDATVIYSHESGYHRAQLDVRYEYSIAGRQLSGDRWRYAFGLGLGQMKSWQVRAVQASYLVGQKVKVAVNPADPAESVLEPGAQAEDLLWVLAGFVLMLAGLHPSRKERRAAREGPAAAPHIASARAPAASGAKPARVSSRPSSAGLLAVVGTLVLAWGLYGMYHGLASQFWPSVQGKIIYSSLYGQTSSGSYRGVVRYQYYLQGKRYLGDWQRIGSRDEARAFVKASPEGSAVTVHYDPSDAADSVLVTGISWRDFVIPAIALVIFVVAWVLKKLAEATRM